MLNMYINKKQPPFSTRNVYSVKSKLTVDLKRDKLESKMRDGPATLGMAS